MLPDQEERIRLRAYEIWEREGRPEGREAEHWDRARREIEEGGTRTQDEPAARVLGTAPTTREIAARDPSGRGRLSEAQERAEQSAFATEADPLGRVLGASSIPDESAMDPSQATKPKRRSGGKGRSTRGKKPPASPRPPDQNA